MFYVRYTSYVVRYIVARFLIHLGLDIMPDSAYKRLLLKRLWELRQEIDTAFEKAKKNGRLHKNTRV